MAVYKVLVCFEAEYDDIEADSRKEAFQIASEWMNTTPIPADIAQKLGIEPKEG